MKVSSGAATEAFQSTIQERGVLMRVLNTTEIKSVSGGCDGCLNPSFDYMARNGMIVTGVYLPGVVLGDGAGGYWAQQWEIWGPDRPGGYPH